MAINLQAIEPLHAPLLPPDGAVPEGATTEGYPLFRLTQKRSRSVPDLDDEGVRRWALHPQNGQPLYPLNKPEIYKHTQLFFLESDGQGNVNHVQYAHPTEEELAAEQRTKDVAAMKDTLAEALVDGGIAAADIVTALAARGTAEPEEEAPEAVEAEATEEKTPEPEASEDPEEEDLPEPASETEL